MLRNNYYKCAYTCNQPFESRTLVGYEALVANRHQMKADVMPINAIYCTHFSNSMIRWNSGIRAGLWSNNYGSSPHPNANVSVFF